MSLQAINFIVIILWLTTGSLVRFFDITAFHLLFAAITWLIYFILAGTSLVYLLFNNPKITTDTTLLVSLGIIFSLFIIPLSLLLLAIYLPLTNTVVLAAFYILLLFAPYLKRKHQLFNQRLSVPTIRRAIAHPITVALAILFVAQFIIAFQYDFLPGMDTYSWIIAYNSSLNSNIYDLSAGINRVLFSTLVAVAGRLSGLDYFTLFKYWFPFVSLLSIIPLWLLARKVNNKYWQLLILLSPLASPAIMLEFNTTRHFITVLVFLYLSLGLLFTAYRYQLASLVWITFLASFIGILYHPIYLVTTVFWCLSLPVLHRQYIQKHPIYSVLTIALFFYVFHLLELTSLISNLYFRFGSAFRNLITLHWNLKYPAQFISEGVAMGWPGLNGVLKFYGYYLGPLAIVAIVCFLTSLLMTESFRRRFLYYLKQPYFLPLTAFALLLFLLAEIFTRFFFVAYLPDRSLTLLGIFTPLILLLFFKSNQSLFSKSLPIFLMFSLMLTGLVGTLFINQAIAYTIPDYEFKAAQWINDYLPSNRCAFTSASKNILRYYANTKRVQMDHQIITSSSLEDITNVIEQNQKEINGCYTFIYYAVTDPRNPYVQRPYASSFTQARPESTFPALTSSSDRFELIYQDPDKVYIWHIKRYE